IVTPADGNACAGKLTVTRERFAGALDAQVEAAAVGLARMLLDERGPSRLCAIAGRSFHFEPVRVPDFAIVLFGAGHVGRALVRTLAELPCRVTWVDARADEYPHEIPANVRVACTDAPDEEVDAAPAGA